MQGAWEYRRGISRAPASKLHLFDSPLVEQHEINEGSEPIHDTDGPHSSQDIPQLKRYEELTLLELFLDLFFAANYEVFGENQHVTNHARFQAYVGYFCLLWLTWFIVALYDVRFVTDSIFARLMRAVQLGVLVGFTVMTPQFDTTDQDAKTMKTMSIILSVSRFSLATEYGSTLWSLRRFKKVYMPLVMQISLHVVSAAILLGIAFVFQQGEHSYAFVAWYFIAGFEALATLLLSNASPVFSLTKTHLMKRLTLMTVMILGNGASEVGKKVVIIVKNADAWEPTTIGHITAAVAVIYFIFLVYFDWIRSGLHLPSLRLQIWTILHFPFNLALVLFMQAVQQYVIWGTVTAQLDRGLDIAYPLDDPEIINNKTTSSSVAAALNSSVADFLSNYPAAIDSTWDTINDAIRNVSEVPDSFWSEFRRLDLGSSVTEVNEELKTLSDDAKQSLRTIMNSAVTLGVTMANALFSNFGIEVDGDIVKKNPNAAKAVKGGGFQFEVQDAAWNLYRLVFAYGYISCGCAIVLMVVLTTILRKRPYTRWQVIRLLIVTALGLGVGLTSTLWFNYDRVFALLKYAWALPIVTIVWTIILIITHINGQSTKRYVKYLQEKKIQRPRASLARVTRFRSHSMGEGDDNLDAGLDDPAPALVEQEVRPAVDRASMGTDGIETTSLRESASTRRSTAPQIPQ